MRASHEGLCMPDPVTPPDPAGGKDDGFSTTGAPRWVKVFAAIVLALALLIVIVLLAGGVGGHGPGQHS